MTTPADEPRILPLAPPARSLHELAATVIAGVLDGRRRDGLPVCPVALDVAAHEPVPSEPRLLEAALAALVAQALDNAALPPPPSDAPVVREVVVTSARCADAVEIEVADSGPCTPFPCEAGALAAIDRLGATLSTAACAEGGRATTLRLPHRRRQRKAA